MESLISIREKRLAQKSCRRYAQAEPGKLFLTIADSDFKIANPIIDDVVREVQTGNMAYSYDDSRLLKSVTSWYWNQLKVSFSPENILFGNGVLYWIHVAIWAFSKPKDQILILTPSYDSFASLIKRTNREVLESPLVYQDHHWSIDFEDLERKMAKSPLMIFCSPHNPTGNVWSLEDLEKVNQLAIKHNTILVFDEIWQDMILKNQFFHSLNLKDQSKIIHISSPAKTFNLGALHYGHMICKNRILFNKMSKVNEASMSYSSNQPWIIAAVESAYTNKANLEWKDRYLKQIQKNANLLKDFLDKHNYQYAYPEGLYLFFVKLGNQNCCGDKLAKIIYDCGAKIVSGLNYGEKYRSWVRIDIAIDDQSMRQLLEVIQKYYQVSQNN